MQDGNGEMETTTEDGDEDEMRMRIRMRMLMRMTIQKINPRQSEERRSEGHTHGQRMHEGVRMVQGRGGGGRRVRMKNKKWMREPA